jgi:hypothetical protein
VIDADPPAGIVKPTIAAIATMVDTTTIEIEKDQWAELNALKQEPGESMKDVIDRLLNQHDETTTPNEEPDPSNTVLDAAPSQEPRDAREADRWLSEVDAPPSSPDRETFEQAAVAVAREIERRGQLARAEAVDALHQDYPAGYAANGRTWWRRVARPVLEAHPDVQAPPAGASDWQYR